MEFDSNLLNALLPAALVPAVVVVVAVAAPVAPGPKADVEVVLPPEPEPEPGVGTWLVREGGLDARLDFLCARR